MIFRHFLTIALAAQCAFVQAAPDAPSADDAVLGAYAAFRAGDALKLARYAAQLNGHLLQPYAHYWRLKLRLEEATPQQVHAFLSENAGSYLAERLRADWLKELGKRRAWQSFDVELAPLVRDDLEIRCYSWSSRLARGDESAYEEAREMWLEPAELPDGCAALAETMKVSGRIATDDVWARARLLFANGRLVAAKRTLGELPSGEAPDERLLAQAASAPERLIAHPPRKLERRATREVLLFAVLRLARNEPQAAAEALQGPLAERLNDEERGYLWGQIAYRAALALKPEALEWYAKAGDAPLTDEQLQWKARAGLRAGDWHAVRDAIDPLSVKARQDASWSYWYGRALSAQGKAEGAHAYFLRIAGQPNFYGVLAAEELGQAMAVPEPFHDPTEAEVDQARNRPGLARALELYRLGLRVEATREWVFTIRSMDDRELLAAAELARRVALYDRAIGTADRTAQLHNYRVRYLAPFRDLFREQSRAYELEEAWVLGLVRQESRFIVDAKSSAGARGLMQLMPSTARWVARKIGLQYSPAKVGEVQTNVTLGTRYLKFVLDDLGHPVLASAAYNAGPGRARRWRDAKPLEGAIYAETIPFDETRDYVKKVMANTVYYAALFGGTPRSLKERLGTIPAKSPDEPVNGELP